MDRGRWGELEADRLFVVSSLVHGVHYCPPLREMEELAGEDARELVFLYELLRALCSRVCGVGAPVMELRSCPWE